MRPARFSRRALLQATAATTAVAAGGYGLFRLIGWGWDSLFGTDHLILRLPKLHARATPMVFSPDGSTLLVTDLNALATL